MESARLPQAACLFWLGLALIAVGTWGVGSLLSVSVFCCFSDKMEKEEE